MGNRGRHGGILEVHEQLQLILEDLGGIGDRVFGAEAAIGFGSDGQLVIIQFLADAGVVHLVTDLANRRIERINRDQADGGIGRTVGTGRDIALAGFNREFHVQRGTGIQVADHQILVHHLHVAGDRDLASGDRARTGRVEEHALGAFPGHANGHLLDVQHDVGHVFTHARQAGEFVQRTVHLDGGDRRALQGGQQHTAQGIAQRQAKAALERFGDKHGLVPAIAAGALLQTVRLFQFGPVLGDYCHGVHLDFGRSGSSPTRPVGQRMS